MQEHCWTFIGSVLPLGRSPLPGPTGPRVQAVQEVQVASALFPVLSLLNHACRPNTSLEFSPGGGGVTLSVRAAEDIASGQEILHCYGER